MILKSKTSINLFKEKSLGVKYELISCFDISHKSDTKLTMDSSSNNSVLLKIDSHTASEIFNDKKNF